MALRTHTKLLFVAVTGLACSAALAAVAGIGFERLYDEATDLITANSAIRNHMTADMMHDALRADVLNALLRSAEGGEQREAVEADLRDHAELFSSCIDANAELDLSPDVAAAVAASRQPLQRYVATARDIVSAAFVDRARALELEPRFMAEFEELEKSQEAITDLLLEDAERSSASTFSRTRAALWTAMGVALAVSIAAAIIGLYVSRRIASSLKQTSSVLTAVAQGDLTKRVTIDGNDDVSRMGESLNKALDDVSSSMAEVRIAADSLAEAATSASDTTKQMSDGAQRQAAALEQTATALEQITGTVKQTASSSRMANDFGMKSQALAENGGRVADEAVRSIRELSRASERIATITTTIDEIAFQTNLLALNAAVEAARAGDQGRGFAVVATEVRTLAQRATTAAREIKVLVEESLEKVQAGVTLVDRSGSSLDEIVNAVKEVTQIIATISTATDEQTAGVGQVNESVSRMDQVVQASAEQATSLASAAMAVAAQAQQLRTLVGRFELEPSRRSVGAPS